MKKEILEVHERVSEVYRKLANNPDLVAPQFHGTTLAQLALVIMNLTQVLDAVRETEQINSGLN